LSYVIATSDKFVDKKVLQLSEHNKIIMRIWFLDDPSVRYALEKAFWKIEPQLARIKSLSFAGIEKGVPIIEYSGDVKLPDTIDVGGQYDTLRLRSTKTVSGHVIFERKA
jgi:hypothetical protein